MPYLGVCDALKDIDGDLYYLLRVLLSQVLNAGPPCRGDRDSRSCAYFASFTCKPPAAAVMSMHHLDRTEAHLHCRQ
jgi:hypothetical protein